LEGSKLGKKNYVIYTRGRKDGYKIFTYDETNVMYNYINVQLQFSKHQTKVNLYPTRLKYFIHFKGKRHLPLLMSKVAIQKLFLVAWTFQYCYDFFSTLKASISYT